MFAAALALAPGLEVALSRMVHELMEWRLADHQSRTVGGSEAVPCKVLLNSSDKAIIKLPDGGRPLDFPKMDEPGELLVTLPDERLWLMRFVKIAINVAYPYGAAREDNQLDALLRSWFGDDVGQPQMEHRVLFERTPLGWTLRPELRDAVPAPRARRQPRLQQIRAYPDLRVAAGVARDPGDGEPETESIELPLSVESGPELFAVRATGASMDGGEDPINDGDWLIMRRVIRGDWSMVRERVALVVASEGDDGYLCQVKRVRWRSGEWWLCSDNPSFGDRPAAKAAPVATLVQVIRGA